ncbi:MAG: 2-phosphosulfolactate phosphatase [Gemmatimonadales bacterium]
MNLSVYFTPLGVTDQTIAGSPVVVVDVLRTTTTIVSALANGARAILPVASAEEALRLAQNLEHPDLLLAGERGSKRIDGFALGNSPLEMTEDVVAGKTLVMATTNGTPALVAAGSGAPVLIGAVTNFTAVAARARAELDLCGKLTILCSGREGMFALEDAYCAGRIAQVLVPGRDRRGVELNDGAIAALQLVRRYGDRWKRGVGASAAARDLKQAGFKPDLEFATGADTHSVVPVYRDRHVTVTES